MSERTGKALWHLTMSLDGFIAAPNHEMGWMAGLSFTPGLVDRYVAGTGAILAGRRGFDAGIDNDPDAAPYGGAWSGPIFVLTHHPKDAAPHDGITVRHTIATGRPDTRVRQRPQDRLARPARTPAQQAAQPARTLKTRAGPSGDPTVPSDLPAAAETSWDHPSTTAQWRHERALLPRYEPPGYARRMKVDKLSVSFEPDLGDAVRSAAAQAGKPVSSWLAEAAASKLRAEALANFLASWEAEHGVLTAEEIARAERELGMTASDTAA